MAASQAPHPLAEAIAEMAAPPLRPSYIRLQLHNMFEFMEETSITLLLHICPRPLAHGMEVALHSGTFNEDAGGEPMLDVEGQLFSMPATLAGVEAFAADLVAAGAGGLDDSGERHSLRPSEQHWAGGWSRVELELLRPEQVRAIPVAGGNANGQAHARRARLRVLPFPGALCSVSLHSESSRYGREQATLRRHLRLWEQQQRREQQMQHPHAHEHPPRLEAAGAPGAGVGPVAAATRRVEQPAELPDSEERYEQRYGQLCRQDQQRLTAALASMLKLALRGRGTASLPLWQPPPAAAPAEAEEVDG